MFRVMEVGPEGAPQLFEGAAAEARVGPPAPGTFRWIDLTEQDELSLALLRERFDFHPLTIEDCSHFDQRPKAEEYGEYLFLVTQGFACGDGHVTSMHVHELHVFLGQRFLVTVHAGDIAALHEVWKRVSGDPALARRGLDFIYYLIADGMVDDNFPILDRVADEIEQIEEAVLEAPKRGDLARIFALKHHLVLMRKVLSPQRDVMAALSKRGDAEISERTALYLRDVYDHLVRINESIEANRDLLGNALDAYLSSVSNRTNEIMKYLTLMSAVFLPLSFVVGFFGQNFQHLPVIGNWMVSDHLMYVMLSLCVGVPILMILLFRRKEWL